jgi:hypothetical protein
MNAPEPRELSVSLALTPQLVADLGREAGALTVAQAYVIDSPVMAAEANAALQDVKRRLTLVEGWRDRFLDPVRQLTDTANGFFNPARTALKAAESHLKTALLGWNKQEEERVAAERRAAEEGARRARAEAEAQAAALRARAQEQAREAQQRAAAAEAERKRAAEKAERLRSEGNAKAAAEQERQARAAAAERARQEEAERTTIEAGEAKAQQATMAAAAMPVHVAGPVKLAGFASKENWVAELTVGEDEAKTAICAAIATGRTDLLALLALDMKAANKLAKAQKKFFNVPGMKAVNRPVATSRAA